MKYNVKFLQESIYNKPDFQPKYKKIPHSLLTKHVTACVRGWEVDHEKYTRIPRSIFFKAEIKDCPKNLKEMSFEELLDLFNHYVIQPYVPITDFQEIKFYKAGKEFLTINKIDLI